MVETNVIMYTKGLVDNGIKKMDWKSVRGYLSVVSHSLSESKKNNID
jgi:hypothetical protein